MSIKDKYTVTPIKPFETYEWLLKKHYAKRIPSISYAFGLSINGVLSGICTFGQPPVGLNNSEGICVGMYNIKVIELNRLVIHENLYRNTLSFFVAKCLRLLPAPLIVVSYADARQGHNGYIYQSTNWVYTGLPQKSGGKEYYINNGWVHNKTLATRHGSRSVGLLDNIYKDCKSRTISPKHRYFYFVGCKRMAKKMKSKLKYKIFPYPKGINKRYDASYKPTIQGTLF